MYWRESPEWAMIARHGWPSRLRGCVQQAGNRPSPGSWRWGLKRHTNVAPARQAPARHFPRYRMYNRAVLIAVAEAAGLPDGLRRPECAARWRAGDGDGAFVHGRAPLHRGAMQDWRIRRAVADTSEIQR